MQLLHTSHISKHIDVDIQLLLEENKFSAELLLVLEIIKGMGVPVAQIRVSGGGARSKFWRQLQADVYGQPVHTINAAEGPATEPAVLLVERPHLMKCTSPWRGWSDGFIAASHCRPWWAPVWRRRNSRRSIHIWTGTGELGVS